MRDGVQASAVQEGWPEMQIGSRIAAVGVGGLIPMRAKIRKIRIIIVIVKSKLAVKQLN